MPDTLPLPPGLVEAALHGWDLARLQVRDWLLDEADPRALVLAELLAPEVYCRIGTPGRIHELLCQPTCPAYGHPSGFVLPLNSRSVRCSWSGCGWQGPASALLPPLAR